MIYCLWKNTPGAYGVPFCAYPVDNSDDSATEVTLFPAVNSAIWKSSELPAPIVGQQVVLSGAFSARQLFTAVILAQAGKIVSALNPSSRVLLFSEGLIGEAVRSALPQHLIDDAVIVRIPADEKSRELEGSELDPYAPGFIDSLKAMTMGKGFPNVILVSSRPEMVRKAMGCAGVLGRVFFLLPIREKVSVDLTATVNYKSIILRGQNFFSGLETLTAENISKAIGQIVSLPVHFLAGEPESGMAIICDRS